MGTPLPNQRLRAGMIAPICNFEYTIPPTFHGRGRQVHALVFFPATVKMEPDMEFQRSPTSNSVGWGIYPGANPGVRKDVPDCPWPRSSPHLVACKSLLRTPNIRRRKAPGTPNGKWKQTQAMFKLSAWGEPLTRPNPSRLPLRLLGRGKFVEGTMVLRLGGLPSQPGSAWPRDQLLTHQG